MKNKMLKLKGRICNPNLIVLILVLIAGLTPLLWFHDTYMINGGDIDYPLNPVGRFNDRLYVWNGMFLGGTDRSMDTTTLFWTAIQSAPSLLGLSLTQGELISFIFWFTLMGLSMLYLIRAIWPENQIVHLSSSIFYMFNFYQFYNWEISRIGEISCMVVIPLSIGLLLRVSRRGQRLRTPRSLLMILLISLIGMGLGVQPPMLIIAVAIFLLVAIHELIFHWINGSTSDNARIVAATLVLAIVYVCANLFWIVPVGDYIVKSGYTSTATGVTVFDTLDLLQWTSRMSGFENVFRLLGRAPQFDTWQGEPYYPALRPFLDNPALIMYSTVLPILAFGALLLARRRPCVLLFSTVSIVGIFLAKGIHPPYEDVFNWIYFNVPGFWIFRAPWEKFGILIALGYAVLIGITVGTIYQAVSKSPDNCELKGRVKRNPPAVRTRRRIACMFVMVIIIGNVAFNYPLLLGKMFPTPEERSNLAPFHQNLPNYVVEASDWINGQEGEFNVLMLPDDRISIYDWGYAAPKDITMNLFNKGVINRQYGEGTATPREIDELYVFIIQTLYNNQSTQVAKILSLLNVKYLLQRNDFRYDFYDFDNYDSPQFIKSHLGHQEGIRLERSFGKWDFYLNELFIPNRVSLRDNIVLVEGSYANIIPLLSIGNYPGTSATIFTDLAQGDFSWVEKLNRTGVLATHPNADFVISQQDSVLCGEKAGNILFPRFFPTLECRRYEGFKEVVSSNGLGDSDMMVFANPSDCPYEFPDWSAHNWIADNSTMLFIHTGNEPLSVLAVSADGNRITDIVGVWWETGWQGMGQTVSLPVLIPENQKCLMQMNHPVSGKLSVVTNLGTFVVPIVDGREERVSVSNWASPDLSSYIHFPGNVTLRWSLEGSRDSSVIAVQEYADNGVTDRSHPIKDAGETLFQKGTYRLSISSGCRTGSPTDGISDTFTWRDLNSGNISVKTYVSSKVIVRTDGVPDDDALVFRSRETCPYEFPTFSRDSWSGSNMTLVFVNTSGRQEISSVLEGDKYVSDIVGVWWNDGWTGMSTKAVHYPIMLPNATQAVIQINHIVKENITLLSKISYPKTLIGYTPDVYSPEQNALTPKAISTPLNVTGKEINPTKYEVSGESSIMGILVLSEPYDSRWSLFDGNPEPPIMSSKLSPENQFLVDGYANGWLLIDNERNHVTIYYEPQSYFTIGAWVFWITVLSMMVASCVTRSKRRIMGV